MAQTNAFPHLSLPLIIRERARLQGGGDTPDQELYNKAHRAEHSLNLRNSAQSAISAWTNRLQERINENLPAVPANIPLFLRVDPDSDLEYLRHFFKLEIVSEQDDGYIIVASEEIDMATFMGAVESFAQNRQGGASAAKIYEVIGPENQQVRLERILSDYLLSKWHEIENAEIYTVDIGVECLGSRSIRPPPEQREGESDVRFNERLAAWKEILQQAQVAWDDLMAERESQLISFVHGHGGQILDILHDDHQGVATLPDSFTVRINISGLGLRDLVFNYPYIFEVREPEVLIGIASDSILEGGSHHALEIESPEPDAPAVCVIDSGIQEEHPLIRNAIDSPASMCFLPGVAVTDVADYVRSGGHGTRVAGAIIYPRNIPTAGAFKIPCWIQNARVLDANNLLPTELHPPLYLRAITEKYSGELGTKLFNHSIAASNPCRLRSMSAWAAAIDMLSWEYDVLYFQSAGNLPDYSSSVPFRQGILDHHVAGRSYPDYLVRPSSRIPCPSESLQALTIGSINHYTYANGHLSSLGGIDEPSPYTTTGLGVWGSIKPEVVEYGGGMVSDNAISPTLTTPLEVCTDLVRSTMYGGPLSAQDEIGTSFSAPKVAAIAAAIQQLLPNEPALLYRSLIVNSARWPTWATRSANKLATLRQIGYGIPDLERATSNTPFRVTLITHGENRVTAKEAHIYQIPVPPELRAPGDEFQIRIDVTLSYAGRPRRTRRNIRQYLSTWVDWRSSYIGESLESFKSRVLKSGDKDLVEDDKTIKWEIRERDDWGNIRGVKRGSSTVQKDWVVLNSHELPHDFCIAVIGHAGWDLDPDAYAKYALTVTFEAINNDIEIYDRIEASVNTIQAPQIEAQVSV